MSGCVGGYQEEQREKVDGGGGLQKSGRMVDGSCRWNANC